MRNQLKPFQGPRLVFFAGIILATFLILVFRLYEWQAVDYQQFEQGAESNAIQTVPLPAPRGVIYDRYGVALALNAPAFNVSIIPANLPDDPDQSLAVLNRLSALIDVPATRASADAAGRKNERSLDEMVTEGEGIAPYRAVVVKTDIPQNIAQQILEDIQNMPGVNVAQPAAVRQYPTGELTSQIVGYLGPISAADAEKLAATGYNPAFERVGYAGVEAALETQLAGTRGTETRQVDVAGLPVRVIKRTDPIAGKNVKLSIDLALQRGAEEVLTKQINHINLTTDPSGPKTITQSGVVIALDPQTGEVLAMVSWPTYDNSRFARNIDATYYFDVLDAPFDPLSNHAVSSLYPPGSTWKTITAGGVAEDKIIAPASFLNDPGVLYVTNSFAPNDPGSRQKFVCWFPQGHGAVDLIHGIAWSCDVYFYQVGGGNPAVSPQTLKPGGLGIENLDRYATMYGIGTREGVELPGEVSGRMPDRDWKRRNYGESWSTGDTYNAAFGQGYVTVTPLQLVNAVASISNGGTLYQPTVINSWVDSGGNVLQGFQPKVLRTIAPPAQGGNAVLSAREDMFIQGKKSLACACDPSSPYLDPTSDVYDAKMPKCTADFVKNYIATVMLDRTQPWDVNNDYSANNPNLQPVKYTVNIPYDGPPARGQPGADDPTNWNIPIYRALCDPRQFKPDYQPAFISTDNLKIVQQGMQGAVQFVGGTVHDVDVKRPYYPDPVQAGKTGTAEFCDDIANKQGLCHPGSWPSHAWFVGYAPFDKPEIIIAAFVYNGGEGSLNALPVVQATMNCYFELKAERARTSNPGAVAPCSAKLYWESGQSTAEAAVPGE
ncbi:MAG TPA: penicillin-binding transpeptidase domain-containing protein [Aggregatilineales bacterium]|nr:penicillin-binding transpeptidase domain-containing protein [Aggregatilineales bacterium]